MKIITILICLLNLTFISNAQNINESISKISKSIIEQLKQENRKSIAIVDFTTPNGSVSELGRSISNRIRINIAKGSNEITIVNRSVLKNALQEEQLFKDGIINPESAKKIKFIGVEALVFGEISDYGNSYSIEIQVIDTETSDMVGGEVFDAPKTENLRKLNESIIINKKTNNDTSASKSIDYSKNFYPMEQDLGNIRVKIENVKYVNNKIMINLKVFNNSNSPVKLGLISGNYYGDRQTKINLNGDVYFSKFAKLANKTCTDNSRIYEIISGKAWVNGMIQFENIPRQSMIPILNIHLFRDKEHFDFTVRDIPIN